jgi:ATP-dependent Clp protease ATP-binding subunit ClpC
MRWSDYFWGFQFSSRRFTDRATYVLAEARHQAARRHCHIAPEHVLLALTIIESGQVRIILERLGVDLQRDCKQLAALVPAASPSASTGKPKFSPETKRLLEQARQSARDLSHNYVGSEHLVLGLLRCQPCPAGNYLRARGVTVEKFREELQWSLANG